MSKNKAKTVEEFDRRFDEGESIFDLAEVRSVWHPNLEPQRVNVDFPKHFLVKLDREAQLRGISRQALIKTWLYERLGENVDKPVTREIALNALAKIVQEISDRVLDRSG